MRCASTSDLYLVTTPTPQALISISPLVWHQRLVHPGHHVFKQVYGSSQEACRPGKEVGAVVVISSSGVVVLVPSGESRNRGGW